MVLTVIVGCRGYKHTELERTDWAPDVKEAVNDFLELYHGTRDAYAVFDFDNTSAIFDVEEQLMAYQLETMSFALNPSGLIAAVSTGLEDNKEAGGWISDIGNAYTVLYDKYGPFSPEGLPQDKAEELHNDPWWLEFASKMGLLYDKVGQWCSTDISYNWVLYWFTGMTEKEVYDLAYRSHSKYSKVATSTVTWTGPYDLKSKVGPVTFEWTSGIQVTENIKELWSALQSAGIDVWVCSASGIQQVLAAIDAFGLHDKCTGVLGMTLKKDLNGRFTPSYDYSGGSFRPSEGGWEKGSRPARSMPAGPGKVTAILNAIAPEYHDHGPLAGFMDSTGDFNFCTEFSSLKMVVCFNRANRKTTDGGGLIAEVAMHQRDNLGYDLQKANTAGDTMYLLQGRDENGLRTLRPSNLTLRLGDSEERLFANGDNEAQLAQMKEMSTADAINRFSSLFLKDYPGYHSLSEKCIRTGHDVPAADESAFIEAVKEYKRSGNDNALKQAEDLAGRMETMPADKELASALVQLYEIDGRISRLAAAELMIKSVGGRPRDMEDVMDIYNRATCHPRLILDDAAFADMKRQIEKGTNPALAKIHGLLMELTDSYGGKTFTKEYDQSHRRILSVSRAALAFITNNAYAYRYTGDRKYLDAAAKAIDEVCSFDDWNPTHFLDVAEMAAGVAIGYDWLWDDLTPEIRAKAERALSEYAVKESHDNDHAWFYGGTNNWNQVCNAGLTLAAIAMRDILGPESGRLITKAISNNRPVVEIIYSPDGNYSEGQMYWDYGTCFQAMLNTTLQSALGADFGLSDVKGFDKTAEYKVFCNGASHKTFNYYDNSESELSSGAMWYFASRFNRPDLLATELQLLDQGRTCLDNERVMPFVMAWATQCRPSSAESYAPKHIYSSPTKNPVVIVRGDWTCSEDDFYLGLKGGSGRDPHAHLDAGNFVFDAFGERWAADYGAVDYSTQEARLKTTGGDFWDMSQKSQRWDVIPLNNEWHNTLTVNGNRHSVSGNGTLLETIDEPGRQGGTMDLTSIFPDLTRAVRTATTDGRSLTVTDMLSCSKPAKVRWTMVTPASCEVTRDGVSLTIGDRKMNLTMSGIPCIWSIRQSDEPVTKRFTVIDADFTLPSGSTTVTTTLAR